MAFLFVLDEAWRTGETYGPFIIVNGNDGRHLASYELGLVEVRQWYERRLTSIPLLLKIISLRSKPVVAISIYRAM